MLNYFNLKKNSLNKCIGIISYLPDNQDVRNIRLSKLIFLLNKLDSLFNLPILLIAQNYKDKDIDHIKSSNITFYKYDKGLGIAHAREELRKKFLETKYDVIILLDDDCELVGSDPNLYLSQIDMHKEKICAPNGAMHKLMSVHRKIYERFSYDLENCPENHNAFEDSIFYWKVYGDNSSNIFRIITGDIKEVSNSKLTDKNSSWLSGLSKETIRQMELNTTEIIKKYIPFRIKSTKNN